MSDLKWLADVLRDAGLKVVEVPGWKDAGRGPMGDVKGVLLHHTAGALSGDHPSLDIVEHGRANLKGPLSHLLLSRDGTYYVVASGRTNHAGPGSWQGVRGNSHFIGIEAENTGLSNDPWPAEQYDAYIRGVEAIINHADIPIWMVAGHKEYATPKGRKIDPSFDMSEFRTELRRRAKKAEAPVEVVVTPEVPETVVPITHPEATGGVGEPVSSSQPQPVYPPGEEESFSLYKPESLPPFDPNSLKGRERAIYAKDLLKKLGWNDGQASAMIGNAMWESGNGLDTNAKGDYMIGKKLVPAGTPGAEPSAYGIMQWRLSRLENLRKFRNMHYPDKEISDLELQVRFIDWELRNTEKTVYKMLTSSNDFMDYCRAAISFCRPARWSWNSPENGMAWKERLTNAFWLSNI